MYGRTQWTEDQRAHLQHLERVKKPTETQRGELRALTMTTTVTGEKQRAARLAQRWETRK